MPNAVLSKARGQRCLFEQLLEVETRPTSRHANGFGEKELQNVLTTSASS